MFQFATTIRSTNRRALLSLIPASLERGVCQCILYNQWVVLAVYNGVVRYLISCGTTIPRKCTSIRGAVMSLIECITSQSLVAGRSTVNA